MNVKVSALFSSPLNKLLLDLGNTIVFYIPVKSHDAHEEWRSAE